MAKHTQPLKYILPLVLAGAVGQARGETLFSDNFDTDTSADWSVFGGGFTVTDSSTTPPTIDLGNQDDFTVQWAFDYSQQSYKLYTDATTFEEKTVPPAPGSEGTSKGVKISVNKKDEVLSRDGVNLYPKGKSFSGDFVLTFEVFMNHSDYIDGGVGTTEYSLYGLNFTGTQMNWMAADFSAAFHAPAPGAGASDGVWFMHTGDGGAGRNWRMCFGQGANKGPIDPALVSAPDTEIALYGERDGDGVADNRLSASDYSPYMRTVFSSPPGEFRGVTGKQWIPVEVSQYQGTVTWKLNGKIISRFQNATPYTAGNIMIGAMDIFDSISNPLDETWVIFDNVKVSAIRTVVVNTADNGSPSGDGKTSLLEALLDLQDFDQITFNIPGEGAQVIATPMGGYPLITHSGVVIDGYTQPGAVPNSNPILGGNNAQLRIVLDSSSTETANNPQNPELPLSTSTRLPFPGYGDSENAILPILAADNVTIRGLSFRSRYSAGSDPDPAIYCVALIQGAMNCKVQGNWFGLNPDGVTVSGSAAGVAAFRYRVTVDGVNVDTFSEGLTVGTDSDSFGDVGEFNIFAGQHIALALELPQLKVAGNYFNVLPSGNNFLDVNQIHADLVAAGADGDSVENIENGRLTTGTIIGVSGDGVNDANERNIFNLAVYDTLTEFYSNAENTRVAGNYYGVGVNGTTTAPPVSSENEQPNFISLPGTAQILIGSNLDGVSDTLEGNKIVGVPGSQLVAAGTSVPIIARANNLSGNQFTGFPFEDGSNGRSYEIYYEPVVVTPAQPAPVLLTYENNILRGTVVLPVIDNYPFVDVDIYLADPAASALGVILPGTYLGTLSEGVPEEDANAAPGEFEFNLTPFNVPSGAELVVVGSYQKDENSSNPGRAIVSPVSNALPTGGSPPITISGVTVEGANLRLLWTGGTAPYQVQRRTSLTAGSWANEGAPVTDRTALVPVTADATSFFQVQGQ